MYIEEPLPVDEKERMQREAALRERAKSEDAERPLEAAREERERLADACEAKEAKHELEREAREG